jgi:hypothetical protein
MLYMFSTYCNVRNFWYMNYFTVYMDNQLFIKLLLSFCCLKIDMAIFYPQKFPFDQKLMLLACCHSHRVATYLNKIYRTLQPKCQTTKIHFQFSRINFSILFSCNIARFNTSCNLDKWFCIVTMGNSAWSIIDKEEGRHRYRMSRWFIGWWYSAVFTQEVHIGTAGNKARHAQVKLNVFVWKIMCN